MRRKIQSEAATSYIPSIDGLRAAAIALVMVSHYGAGRLLPGGFGVTFFFFISGFLITNLLIAEMEGCGKISMLAFYVRRFFRLAPALMFMIFVVSVVYRALVGPVNPYQIAASTLYFANYYQIFGGEGHAPLGVLWSLSVEEHYYLVFPIVFSLSWKHKRTFLIGLVAACAVILVWRLYLVVMLEASEYRTYYASDTRIDSILYGAILACLMSITNVTKAATPLIVVLGISVILLSFVIRNPIFRETWRYSVQGLALIPIFYSIVFDRRYTAFRRALENPTVVWFGKISYSLYLWHIPVLFFAEFEFGTGLIQYLLAGVMSILLAASSYYFVEGPLRRRYNNSAILLVRKRAVN